MPSDLANSDSVRVFSRNRGETTTVHERGRYRIPRTDVTLLLSSFVCMGKG